MWWPLATSWLFMGLELPAVSAALARLPDPTISLAAYGGVIFPLALLIESPIIMLLSASTALSKDLRSHELVGRFMWSAGLGFTALHALVAWTPLYDVVVEAIREETGTEPELSTSGGTSDGRFLIQLCPVVDFGLPNATMHKVDESAAVEDVHALSRIYERIVSKALA